VVRSERGGWCGEWQEAQFPCAGIAWSAGRRLGTWHVVQDGGVATPSGPWGRWQVSQPPCTAPCALAASAAWHEPQLAGAGIEPEWASWHPTQFWWPAGAVDCSLEWHVGQAAACFGL
jgi:hypothetical protein